MNKMNQEQPNKFATTTYATPAVKQKGKGKQNPNRLEFRNHGDKDVG